jgi:hypothetical protein
MLIWAFLLSEFVCCAGAPSTSPSGERMTFFIEWEGVDPSLHLYPPALILTETRSFSQGIPDGQVRTTLRKAGLSVVLGNRFTCEVPNLGNGAFVPLWLTAYDNEHRFTVFTPGYAAATVYPRGLRNHPQDPNEAPDPDDLFAKPTLLRAEDYEIGTHLNARDTHLASRHEASGENVFVLRLRKLPLEKPLPRWDFFGAPSLYDEVFTFYSQLASLKQAIGAHYLDKADKEQRRILGEAVRLEYESFVATLVDPRGMKEQMKPLLDRLRAWTRVPATRPTATAPGPQPRK